MPLTIKSKILVAVASLSAFVLLAAYITLRPKPIAIGGYRMPEIEGWTHNVSRTADSSNIYYHKKVGNSRLSFTVRWSRDSRKMPPQNIQQLQKEVDKQHAATTGQFYKRFNFKFAPSKIVTFAGHPAVESRWTGQPSPNRESETREVRFLDKGKYFQVTGSFSKDATQNVAEAERVELGTAFDAVEGVFRAKE